MPQIDNLASTYRDRGLLVLGINISDPLATVQAYQDQYKNILMLRDSGRVAFNKYKRPGSSIPLNYLLDHDGRQTVNYWTEGFNLFLIQSKVVALLGDVSFALDCDANSFQQGTSLGFDLYCRNWSANQVSFYRIIDVRLTSGKYYKLYPAKKITLGPNVTKGYRFDFPLPAAAPLGTYMLRVRGGLPGDLWNTDIALFEVIP